MTTLYQIFKYNNMPYSELTDENGKTEIEHWVNSIKDTDVGEKILKDYHDRYINIRTVGMLEGDQNYIWTLPDDLFYKVCRLAYPPTN